MRRLRPSVDEAAARRLLAARWWMRLAGRLPGIRRHIAARLTGRRLRVELVWLPYYRVDLVGTPPEGPEDLAALVSASDGELILLRLPGAAWEDEVATTGRPQFAPVLAPDDARRIAEQASVAARVRTGSQSGGPAPTASGVELVEYPLWVAYIRRRAGWDIRVVDGVTGRPGGPRLKRAVLGAFVRGHRQPAL